MHAGALAAMDKMVQRFVPSVTKVRPSVLDVGSLDINGTYKSIFSDKAWKYTGLDIMAGPNVDVVSEDPYVFPFKDDTFELVISGSTMEHVESIWVWVPELVRVLRPGGLIAILTHWQFPEHKYPVDCWRILPDGMKHLFDLTGKLRDYDIAIVSGTDIAGSAFKIET